VIVTGATSSAILAPLLIVPAVAVGSVYLDLDVAEALAWGGVTLAGVVVGLLIATVHIARRSGALSTWVAGDERDPTAAWAELLRLPQALGIRVLTIVVPFATAVSLPTALELADPSRAGVVGLVYAYLLVGAAGYLLTTSCGQLLARSAAADVAGRIGPVQVEESRAWTVRRRLLLATFVAASLAAVGTPVLVYGTGTTEGDYADFLLFGGVFAVYLCLVLDVGMFQPTLAPVRDLIAGMVRVRRGDLDQPVAVTSPDEIGGLAAAFNEMVRGLRQRDALHAAFGSYVDPGLAQRLVESGSSVFEGEETDVSVMFADVRDFTSFADAVEPAEAVQLLNRLFDVIVPALHDHGGHANHYLGDGLLAIFGAPSPLVAHADAAVAAAVDVQRRVREEFGGALRLGIGINTGPVIAGTVGGGGRHEFTVIGDTVNVASRVEQLTKDTGDAILITEATRLALRTPRPRTTKRGAVQVRGKSAKVVLHAVNPFPRSRP
jgi:class 3 adenylate cyclase